MSVTMWRPQNLFFVVFCQNKFSVRAQMNLNDEQKKKKLIKKFEEILWLFPCSSRAFFLQKKIISIPLTAFPFNYSQLRGYWFFYSFLILSLPVHGTYTWVASKTTQPTCFLTIVGLSCVLLTAIAIELNTEQCKSHNKRRRRRTKSNYSINSSSFCGFVKWIWKIAFSFLFRVSL